MSYPATVIKVMISSPADVNDERRIIREVIADWNSAHSEPKQIVLMPIGWETHSVPDTGDRPQAIINNQLKGCDILVGVFWTRIGTPTGEYDSGTIEEIEEHIKLKKPAMLYFSDAKANPSSINPEQQKKLEQFKQSCKERSLYQEYSSIDVFRKEFSRHLQQKMNQPEFIDNKQVNMTSQEMKTDGNAIPNLTSNAQMILKECSYGSHGSIEFQQGYGNFTLSVGHIHIIADNPRKLAQWENVIPELENNNLIKFDSSRRGYILTGEGYNVADSMPNQ